MVDVGLNITAGALPHGPLLTVDPNIQFFQPYTLNAIDPARMLIGTKNIYESLDGGDTLNNLGSVGAIVGTFARGRPMVYGGRLSGSPNPNVFYVGAGATIFHRVTAAPGPITQLLSYPGGPVVTIAINPNNYKQVYVSDENNKVWGSSDEGATWVNLTANLPSSTSQVATIEVFSPDATVSHSILIAGGFGVFYLPNPSNPSGHWTKLTGFGDDRLSNALVLDLHFDYTRFVLAAGTLGRGAWLFGQEDVIGAVASRNPPSTSSIAATLPPVSVAAKRKLPPAPPPVMTPRSPVSPTRR